MDLLLQSSVVERGPLHLEIASLVSRLRAYVVGRVAFHARVYQSKWSTFCVRRGSVGLSLDARSGE